MDVVTQGKPPYRLERQTHQGGGLTVTGGGLSPWPTSEAGGGGAKVEAEAGAAWIQARPRAHIQPCSPQQQP